MHNLLEKRKSEMLLCFFLIGFFNFFDIILLQTPYLISADLYASFISKAVEFGWPLFFIYIVRWVSPAEVGLTKPNVNQLLLGIGLGVALGLLAFFNEPVHSPQDSSPFYFSRLLFMFLMAGPGEELVYRGFLPAVFNKFSPLGKSKYNLHLGWGIFVSSVLFIGNHMVYFDLVHVEFAVNKYDGVTFFIELFLPTMALVYLRVKSNSIWPGVLCHNLINGTQTIAPFLIS
jgi:membrane protease YdiL (CAAX protease family)